MVIFIFSARSLGESILFKKTSRMINRAIMTGILSTGVNVHDYGVTPMPVVRYLARSGNEISGVHVRRSPFDSDIIDLKFFDNKGLNLHSNQEKGIEKLFFREDFRRARMEETGEMTFPVYGFEYYQNGFMSSIDAEAIKKAGFKMVLDYSYGSSSRIFPAILGNLNLNIIALNANLDGAKITKTADEFQNSLVQLSSIVRSLRADIGVMLDAGGEKILSDKLIDAKEKKVVVIGGGDTGADCVGTANRQGASCVVQIEVLPKPAECRTDSYPWPKYPLILKTSTSHEEGSERHWSIFTKKSNFTFS